MSGGRLVAAVAASLAVAGCATVAVGISRAADRRAAAPTSVPASSAAPRPVVLTMSRAARPSAVTSAVPPPAITRTSSALARPSGIHTSPVARPSINRAPRSSSARPTVRTSAARVAPRGQPLPLSFGTGTASRVITVTARSAGSTVATLQAWDKVTGGGWRRHGAPVTAHVGADGLSSHPSEWRSATPIGSFTLTQAFGRYGNPGTGLAYFRTTAADWWISQTSGTGARYYNTHQRCSGSCAFAQGDPNEHLYYETPYYNYAVVIDFNTPNAPGGVHLGAGSAFFLHVTDGRATAGCVAIPQSDLVGLLRWLTPAAHPRILIGVG